MQYALIENGVVSNIAVADEAAAAELPGTWVPGAGACIGWHYDGEQFTPPVVEAPPPIEARRITRLAFRKRFTQAEKVALEIAALDDPSATPAQRAQAAALRAYLKDVDAATFIDLADAHVAAGVQTLEAAGLLAAGRAAEIINAPVTAEELP